MTRTWMTRTSILLGVLLLIWLACAPALRADDDASWAPRRVLLWPDGAPGAAGETEADQPSLRIYHPPVGDQRTGAGVVICPGGGYGVLAFDHEGHQVARWFNRHGVSAYVLRYRHAPQYRHPAPLQDVQRALRWVRQHENEIVDPARLGVMGFSAGGHLASTAATHFDRGRADAEDPVERQSCRPDFAVLCYPVVSLTAEWGHRGSRNNLLGDRKDDEQLAMSLSNDQQVSDDSPPTFLFHTAEDRGVPPQNSIAFFTALRAVNVPAELHIYQYGPHGVGLAAGDPVVGTWPDRMLHWMRTGGLLAATQRAAVRGEVVVDGEPLRWGAVTFLPETPQAPAAWSMVRNGKFSIPADRGAVVGTCRIQVRDLGQVVPRPTIDDQRELPTSGIVYRITADGTNQVNLDLRTE